MEILLKYIPDFLENSLFAAFLIVFLVFLWILFRRLNELNEQYLTKLEELNEEFRNYLKNSVKENREYNAKVIEAFEMLTESYRQNTEAIQQFNKTMIEHQSFWKIKKKET